MTEFNLSEKIEKVTWDDGSVTDLHTLEVRDVKEFIRLEAELFWKFHAKKITIKKYIMEKDALAGDKFK